MSTLLRYIEAYQEYIILFATPFVISFAFFLLMMIIKRFYKQVHYWHGGIVGLLIVLYFAFRLNGLQPTSAVFVNRFSFFLIVLSGLISYTAFAVTAHALRKRT